MGLMAFFKRLREVAEVRASSLFDEEYYLKATPRLARMRRKLLPHYIKHGWKRGKSPSNRFDLLYYLYENPHLILSGENPLLHFIRTGKSKRLRPVPSTLSIKEPAKEAATRSNAEDNKDAKLLAAVMEGIGKRKAIIVASHSDYKSTVAGVEIHMLDEQKAFNERGICYIQLSPAMEWSIMRPEGVGHRVCVNVDGERMGEIDSVGLEHFISCIANGENELLGAIVHHLRGWNLEDLLMGFKALGQQGRVLFWIHDYFSVCPQTNLLRNNEEYCGAPPLASASCKICRWSYFRRDATERLRCFFEQLAPCFLTPSESSREIWARAFPEYAEKVEVVPLLSSSEESASDERLGAAIDADGSYKPKLAYAGYPNPLKGWPQWRSLIDSTPGLKDKYELFYFGKQSIRVDERYVKVRVSERNRGAMVDALASKGVDMVFIWTKCPETYCYVMHEALAAGSMVLTHKGTGNVARHVRENRLGRVFESFEEMVGFLSDVDGVKSELIRFKRENPKRLKLQPVILTPDIINRAAELATTGEARS